MGPSTVRSVAGRRCTALVLAAGLCLLVGYALGGHARATLDESPHAAALALVLSTNAQAISQLEEDKVAWWHDTKKRQWSVQRPFEPGGFDTTHLFLVVYTLDGTEMAQWTVDTRTKQLTMTSRRGVAVEASDQ